MLYLLKKYWPQMPRPLIGGYTKPGFSLDADWYHIGRFIDYPVEKWSDGLIEFLNHVEDDIVLFMMDDYWLNAPVNHDKIMALADYLQTHNNIARVDVTHDRLKANWTDLSTVMGIDDLIVSEPGSQYYFSYQAALWRKSMLLECLVSGETPWESELRGSYRLNDRGYYVIGSKQYPMRYTIAVQHGRFTPDGGYQVPPSPLDDSDRVHILDQGWVPVSILNEQQHA